MQYSLLGQTGVRTSRIVLGTASFGVSPDAKQAQVLVSKALELGINHFDTANIYGVGPRFDRPGFANSDQRPASETVLGAALKGHRHDVLIATKAAERVGEGPNDGGLSRVHLMKELEESLRRLETDYIDIFYSHHDDPSTPIAETLAVYDEMIRAGKVRYCALSNYSAWRVTEALWRSDGSRFHAPVCLQNAYSLANRAVERELLPASRHFGLGFLAYSPLAGGLLSGADILSRPVAGSQRWGGRGFNEVESALAQRWDDASREAGVQPAQLATAWLLAQPGVTGAIIGAERFESLQQSCEAAELELSSDLVETLGAVMAETPAGGR